jgi:hypothetical protein
LKYFICALGSALGKINIGIPAEMTERIIAVTRIQGTVRETENQEVFISLPALMRQKETPAPHGVVLKAPVPESQPVVKTTLLTPKIDAETEIPEEGIHGLPKAMDGTYKHFRGAYCTGKSVILILAPEKLLEGII